MQEKFSRAMQPSIGKNNLYLARRELGNVLINYCCITQNPKTQWLKTTILLLFIFPWFHWVVFLIHMMSGRATVIWKFNWAGKSKMALSHSFQLVMAINKTLSQIHPPEYSPSGLSIQIWLLTTWLLDFKGQVVEPICHRLNSPEEDSENFGVQNVLLLLIPRWGGNVEVAGLGKEKIPTVMQLVNLQICRTSRQNVQPFIPSLCLVFRIRMTSGETGLYS